MKHCPNAGAKHKSYYVRLNPAVVQCCHPLCNKTFVSQLVLGDAEYEKWQRPDIEMKTSGDFLGPEEAGEAMEAIQPGVNPARGMGLREAYNDYLDRRPLTNEPGQFITARINPGGAMTLEQLDRATALYEQNAMLTQMPPIEHRTLREWAGPTPAWTPARPAADDDIFIGATNPLPGEILLDNGGTPEWRDIGGTFTTTNATITGGTTIGGQQDGTVPTNQ